MKKCILLFMACMMILSVASAEENVWTVITEAGEVLTQICYEPAVGDQYVTGDNALYEITGIDGDKAIATHKGDFILPDVSWLDADETLAVAALQGERLLALYCTHSDESYEPSDGLYSDPKRGSIYEVAQALAEAFGGEGVEAEVSRQTHLPHDAGAYRRSRQTAVELLKRMPDAIFDIHRDGIPDPDAYAVEIGGKEVSKVRLLVGRGNQNMEVNKQFAAQLKAVADKVYPGLIKDIYMGKGVYNQDLAPQSLLFECGTYTLEKQRVLDAMPMLADAVTRTLYGGVTGSAGRTDTSAGASERGDGVTTGEPDPVQAAEDKGTGAGLIWLIGLAVVGLVIFAFAATGSARGAGHKIGRNISEMTGGLLGRKPKEK